MRMVTKMTLRDLNKQLIDILSKCSFIENPVLEVRLILSGVLKKTLSSFLCLSPQMLVDSQIEELAVEFANERKKGRSIAAILGLRDFYDLQFEVDDNVLIPRPETEFLVEYVLNLNIKKKIRVLDVGAGSGTICVTIAKHRPQWDIEALEVSKKAVRILKRNVDCNNVNVNIIEKDFFNFEPAHSYDLILSNPPYIPTDDVVRLLARHDADDPLLALDGGSDGLIFYRELKKFAAKFLDKNGMLVMEHGFDQKKSMYDIFNVAQFRVAETLQDYAGLDRITIVNKIG